MELGNIIDIKIYSFSHNGMQLKEVFGANTKCTEMYRGICTRINVILCKKLEYERQRLALME